jgi:hypothetical protein
MASAEVFDVDCTHTPSAFLLGLNIYKCDKCGVMLEFPPAICPHHGYDPDSGYCSDCRLFPKLQLAVLDLGCKHEKLMHLREIEMFMCETCGLASQDKAAFSQAARESAISREAHLSQSHMLPRVQAIEDELKLRAYKAGEATRLAPMSIGVKLVGVVDAWMHRKLKPPSSTPDNTDQLEGSSMAGGQGQPSGFTEGGQASLTLEAQVRTSVMFVVLFLLSYFIDAHQRRLFHRALLLMCTHASSRVKCNYTGDSCELQGAPAL